MMAGSSSGVSPTASASAKSSDSTAACARKTLIAKTTTHHHQHDLREQVAEAADAALELGLRRRAA